MRVHAVEHPHAVRAEQVPVRQTCCERLGSQEETVLVPETGFLLEGVFVREVGFLREVGMLFGMGAHT